MFKHCDCENVARVSFSGCFWIPSFFPHPVCSGVITCCWPAHTETLHDLGILWSSFSRRLPSGCSSSCLFQATPFPPGLLPRCQHSTALHAQAPLQPRILQLLPQLLPLLYCCVFSSNSMRQAFRTLPVLLGTEFSNEKNQFLRF